VGTSKGRFTGLSTFEIIRIISLNPKFKGFTKPFSIKCSMVLPHYASVQVGLLMVKTMTHCNFK